MTNIHRKVFDELAEMLKSHWYNARPSTEPVWNSIVLDMADVLKANCSTFDKARFFEACGMKTEKPFVHPPVENRDER